MPFFCASRLIAEEMGDIQGAASLILFLRPPEFHISFVLCGGLKYFLSLLDQVVGS